MPQDKGVDHRFHDGLSRAGLLPFALMIDGAPTAGKSTTPVPQIDRPLLLGLVDQWHPETHTFHFSFGDMTITLKDTAMITGLPIRGNPLVVPRPSTEQWQTYVQQR